MATRSSLAARLALPFVVASAAAGAHAQENPANREKGAPQVAPAAAPSAPPAPPAPPAPTAWLRGKFVERKWEPTAAQRSLALLDDGELDLRLVEHDGHAWLHLLQPGTAIGAGSYLRGSPFRPPEELVAALNPGMVGALHFEFQPSGDPYLLQPELRVETGAFVVVRTLRTRFGGGGALAVLTCRNLVLPPEGATAATFEVAVLALDPAASRVPRLDESFYEANRGATTGMARLFATSHWHHPVLSSFDVLRLDRDHLEWNGGRPRDFELLDDDRLFVPDGSGADLRPMASGEMRFPRQSPLPRGSMPIASGSNFAVHAHDLGFDRLLRCNVSTLWKKGGLLEFTWSDVKADAIVPLVARGHDVTVLDESGEPVAGAFVYARSAAASDWPPPALFSVVSNAEGRARLPVRSSDDARAVEVVALEAGSRARFGARRGAELEAGEGGECVVLLDHVEATRVAITPPPAQVAWAGLELDGVALQLQVAADGTLNLPALGRAATLHLGRPWVAQSVALKLEKGPAAPIAIAAKFAWPLERRVRLMSAGDGQPVERAQVEEVEPEDGLYVDHGTLVVPAEFAGQAVKAKVKTRDFEPLDVVVPADAARDAELPLKRKGG